MLDFSRAWKRLAESSGKRFQNTMAVTQVGSDIFLHRKHIYVLEKQVYTMCVNFIMIYFLLHSCLIEPFQLLYSGQVRNWRHLWGSFHVRCLAGSLTFPPLQSVSSWQDNNVIRSEQLENPLILSNEVFMRTVENILNFLNFLQSWNY